MNLEQAVSVMNARNYYDCREWYSSRFAGTTPYVQGCAGKRYSEFEVIAIAEKLEREADDSATVEPDWAEWVATRIEQIETVKCVGCDEIPKKLIVATNRLTELEAHVGSIDGCNASINRQLDKHLARIYAVEQAIEKATDRLGTTTEIAVLTNRINQCHRDRCEDYADHRKRLGEAFEGIESLSAKVVAINKANQEESEIVAKRLDDLDRKLAALAETVSDTPSREQVRAFIGCCDSDAFQRTASLAARVINLEKVAAGDHKTMEVIDQFDARLKDIEAFRTSNTPTPNLDALKSRETAQGIEHLFVCVKCGCAGPRHSPGCTY